MSDLFKNFREITGKNLPCPKNLSLDEKAALVHQLKMAGENMTAIANYLGVSRKYAYDLLKKANQERLEELECQTYTSNFVSLLHDLEATRDLHRKRVSKLHKIIENGWINPDTGEKIEKTGLNRDLSEAARIVRDYDRLIIDVQKMAGVLPDKNPNPYGTLRDKAPKEVSDVKELRDRASDELIEMLLNKLMNRPATSILKSMGNDPIL